MILAVILLLFPVFGSIAQAQELFWAKRAGGHEYNDFGTGIAVDGSGNVYVTGNFQGTAHFELAAADGINLNSEGDYDLFVAKYSWSGTLLWAKRAGGTIIDYVTGIAVDGSGNVYVTGLFRDTATFGLGEPNQTILTSAGDYDLFVAKYDSTGGHFWAKRAGGHGYADSRSIAVDGSGNVYLTGRFGDTRPECGGFAFFGEGEQNETRLWSNNLTGEIFVAKYHTDGGLVWAQQAFNGDFSIGGLGVAVGGGGNVYVTGAFRGTARFGGLTLNSAGSDDIFMAKYNSAGTPLWAKRAGGISTDEGQGIAVDGSGNIYQTGTFEGTVTFDGTTLNSYGYGDIFVAKYSSLFTLPGHNIVAYPRPSPYPFDPKPPVKVTFAQVTGLGGITTMTGSQSGPTLPPGFQLGNPNVYLDIQTTATVVPPITVCIDYSGISFETENRLRLWHWTAGVPEDKTTSLDTANDIICGVTSSLSPFAILEATYQFVGFFPPVKTGPAEVNLVKAGSATPLKWQLRDKSGAFISDFAKYTNISYQEISCSGSTLLSDLGQPDSSGSSGLKVSGNQYHYNWKTEKNMKGKCYRLNVKLFDSDVHSADFQMW
jgi:hypothetical protein